MTFPPTVRPGHRPPGGGRSRVVRERAPVERGDDPSRHLGRTLHARDEILHDAGAGMQLPVGELFQDDRAQQLVVGRRHGDRRRRAQPRGEIGQGDAPVRRRQLGRPAADGRAARASDCRDGTARVRARGRRGRSGAPACASLSAVRSATFLPSRSARIEHERLARAAQMRPRWVLPLPGGPFSASAGAGQSGQRSIQASASRLPSRQHEIGARIGRRRQRQIERELPDHSISAGNAAAIEAARVVPAQQMARHHADRSPRPARRSARRRSRTTSRRPAGRT